MCNTIHANHDHEMSILKYFKRQNELPDAKGSLSTVIASSAITAANEEVKVMLNKGDSRGGSSGKRGRYNR